MRTPLFILLIICSSVMTTSAQVAARHVENPPEALAAVQVRIKSPMALDVPLVVDRTLVGVGRVRGERLWKYICDGVSYRDYSLEVRRPRHGRHRVIFRFRLWDEPGIDKRVDVALELVQTDKAIGSATSTNIKLGEEESAYRTIELLVDETDLQSETKAVVRLTTVVRDDP
jgi:hypothetical protein